jgi:hypothetical protein
VPENDYDSDEIKHHCHSDVDAEELDPYYEYNKCNQFKFLEKRIGQEKVIPITLNQFAIRYGNKEKKQCDLYEELDRIIKRKYLHAMQQLVNPSLIIDAKEERNF